MLPGSSGIRLLIISFLFLLKDSTQSLIILSFVQSPPPIQFPDLTVATLQLFFKKDLV